MTEFQEKQIGVIHYMLNNWSSSQKIILKFIIRQYAEILPNEKTCWRNVTLYKKHHQITERAEKKMEQSDDWKEVHFEHIVPVGVIYNKLINLKNPTIENIKEVMSECEVVILSKEESTVLDGSPKKLYELDGKKVPGAGLRSKGSKIERLNAVGAVLSEKYINNSLDG